MEVRNGELKQELVLPEQIFTREEIKSRRASCFQRGVRSRVVFHAEDDDHFGYYDLTIVGPAHEMQFASMMFSFFDDTEFKLRK